MKRVKKSNSECIKPCWVGASAPTTAKVLLAQVADPQHRPELVWVDGGCAGSLVVRCLSAFALVLEKRRRSGRCGPR
ncbi:hypothetical protein ABZ621_30575 [Streptomyces sp. NPDC007863]|uniref:hypothetical protein n=1 Tax=Streptomyces sp. NPDC007863 TaxID=3154894 RepID=UPI0033DF0D16